MEAGDVSPVLCLVHVAVRAQETVLADLGMILQAAFPVVVHSGRAESNDAPVAIRTIPIVLALLGAVREAGFRVAVRGRGVAEGVRGLGLSVIFLLLDKCWARLQLLSLGRLC
ncbi:hypothetical protein E2C01_048442 [Portunus trituberculatus]|uniref:Uncharacterized protein n=1 Tax=Portunus trituberculatus TaxID=210409 RepID=A0A5B7G6F4_PORTR|nr:hypothetical protein [Portunus trituberculatus]